MARPPDDRSPDVPEAVAAPRSRWRVQLVWLVPLVAVLIGGWLAVKAILEKGPTITISFATGEGLEAGKTKIKFKNVDIGVVKSVVLSPDHKRVIATRGTRQGRVEHAGRRHALLGRAPAHFRRHGVGHRHAAVRFVHRHGRRAPQTKPRRDFVGLETPPVFASGVPGREFVLKSDGHGLARCRLADLLPAPAGRTGDVATSSTRTARA